MTTIHPTAIVSPKAEIDAGVTIGPYCVIGENVSIGADTTIGAHTYIEGHTKIGERNVVSPFVCIGTPPQDIGYKGQDTRVRIAHDNIIREYATVHRASTKEEWETVIGSHNYLMAYVHIAHDCALGDHIIMANAATLGGHVHVGDHANLGGLVAVHQFVHVGAYAFIGGLSGVPQFIPPYMLAAGPRADLYGINQKGLVRNGFSKEIIADLKKAYRIIWRDNRRLEDGIRQAKQEIAPSAQLDFLLDFLENVKRGVVR